MADPCVTRLPFVPIPVESESFPSWVDRCARELEVSPAVIAKRLGLEPRNPADQLCRPKYFGVLLTEESLRNARAATGLPASVLEGMQLVAFDGTALDLSELDKAAESSLGPLSRREWAHFRGSRVCPECLAGAPVWMLWWRLSVAAVCPKHRVVLRGLCETCLRLPRSGFLNEDAGLSARLLPTADRCTNRTAHGFCLGSLTNPTRRATAEEVEMQRQILSVIASREGPTIDNRLPASQWFAHLRAMVALLRRAAAADATRRSPLAHGRAPADPEESVQLLVPATKALVSGNMPEQLSVLARAEHFPDLLDASGLPAVLTAGWGVHCGARTRTVVGLTRRRLGALELPLSGIPQRVTAEMYDLYIRDAVPGTAVASGRVLTSLAAAHLVGAGSWTGAGRCLELPESRTLLLSDSVYRRVENRARFWDGVHSVAEQLIKVNIDFAARRRAFAELTALPLDEWRGLARPHRFTCTHASARNAAVWIWDHVVCGDLRQSPALVHQDGTSRESRVESYRSFCRRAPQALLTDLERWALAVLGKADEPL